MMSPNENPGIYNAVDGEDNDDQHSLTTTEESIYLLNQMKPILKSMERGGTFLDILLEAFQNNERLLLEKIMPALPAKWMKAPDQRLMLNYNWHCPNAPDRLLNFKNDKIRLDSFREDGSNRTRRLIEISSPARQIHCNDFLVSRDGLSHIIKGGGCSCCNGNQKNIFTLFYHPQKVKYKLLVQEIYTAFCTSSDNIEEPYDGYDYVAYIQMGDTNVDSESNVDISNT